MITNYIYNFAKSDGKSSAVICDGMEYSYTSFFKSIQATQGFFSSIEKNEKKLAVVLIKNLFDAWLAVISLRSIGFTTISVSNLLQLKQLKLSGIAFVVTTEIEQDLHNFQVDLAPDIPVVAIPGEIYRDIMSTDLSEPLNYGAFGDHIIYSSGTTGSYKKLVIPYSSEAPRLRHRNNTLIMDETTRCHCFDFGLWTAIGYNTPLLVWQQGGCVIFDRTPHRYSRFFKLRVTDTICIAPMAQALLGEFSGPIGGLGNRFQKLREIIIGGSFVNQNLAQNTADKLTQKLTIGYGSSELGGRVLESHYQNIDDLLWLKVSEDTILEVVNIDGQICKVGEEGDLRIKLTDRDCHEYLDDPEATARFFKDGYFYPGDLAVTAEDGRVRVLGRVSDVLTVGAQKLAVAPIERDLEAALGVQEVCVFSGLTSDGIHELVIAIRSPTAPKPAQQALVRKRFSMFKAVRFITLPAFPLTTNGMMKTNRVELRKSLFADT